MSNQKRLLFVIDSLGSGGAQRQMVTLALGLIRRNYQIEFFIYHPECKFFQFLLDEHKIKVHEFDGTQATPLSVVYRLRQVLQRQHYDLVLSFLDIPNFYAEIATRGLHLPLVVSERNSYRGKHPPAYKLFLEQFHRFANKIVVNSYYQHERMLQYHPWMQEKLQVIYNGLSLNRFHPLSLHPPKNKFLCVGSVIPRKNPVTLVKALQICRDKYHYEPVIDWYGARYDTVISQNTYNAVEMLLDKYQLRKQWQWCGVSRDMHKIYPQYQALIHPSRVEGLPNAIMEAMACGLPILAGNVCENPRLVEHGRTGFLFNPDEPKSIANAIRQFLALGEPEISQMAEFSRARAQSLFDLEIYLNHFEHLFQSLT